MTPLSNVLSAARLTVTGIANQVTTAANSLQRKFTQVTDACLPKPLAPLFRNLVTSLPITYATLTVPTTYTVFAVSALFLLEVAKDMGGEPRAAFPGPSLQKAFNNGIGGAFVYTAAKMLFTAAKTLWKVGTVKDPVAKAAAVCITGFVGSFFYSRKTNPTIPSIGSWGSSSCENVETTTTARAATERTAK